MERSIEVEAKFEAEPGFVPDLGGVAMPGETRRLVLSATYHDTPERSLHAAGWSLRRRSGGVDDGWHLKRPRGDGPGRVEVHAELSDEMPPALRAEANEVVGTAPLVPVADLTTERTETALLVDGEPVAWLSVDRVRARAADRTTSWLEVEVELLPGVDPAVLGPLSAALVAQGARPAGHASKVGRVLATEPARPSGAPTAGEVLLGYAARQVGMLQATDAGVRVDAPDTVHKARVATRRLRSLLKTFAAFWDAARARALRAELSWLADLLGAPRDAEVLAEEFGDLFAELGPDGLDPVVRRRVLGRLEDTHDRAHGILVTALATPRARALRAELVRLLVEPPLGERAGAPASDLTGALDAAIARVERLHERALRRPDKLERWHEVRKAAKAVRYCTEALAEVLGADFAERAEAWESVTEAFGTLQDAVVATELLTTLAQTDAATPREDDWSVLLGVQADRAEAALAAGQAALASALGSGAGPGSASVLGVE